MRRIASASDRVYADIVAQFPDPPAGSRIFVVNQCPMAAVGVDQAFKLWYGREDVGGFALSVSPHLHGSTRDVVSAPAADVIEIRREGGVFFRSFVERFLLFAVKPADLGVAAGRCGLRLMEGVDPAREVTVLRLGLPYSLSASRLALFEWDNSQVGASLYDLILGVDLPGMLRLRPAPTPGGSE
jgi:hypothetical protein